MYENYRRGEAHSLSFSSIWAALIMFMSHCAEKNVQQ